MAKSKARINYYDTLEVSSRARQEVIKAAYRALMKIYHPDLGAGNETAAKAINEAFRIISNSIERARYDNELNDFIGKTIGGYQIVERIAEGGFGRTYKGVHILLGEPVCLKDCSKVDPQYQELLLEEAKAIWDLRHYSLPAMRNILRLDDGTIVLVMSYIPGPTLEQIVKKVGRLDPEHVAWITERILNALMYLHFNGVVHGDVKPQNIIVQPESHTVVLVDFGLSLIKPNQKSESKGHTEYFAPPEEINGAPLVPESDFFSLGMTMIYALGGGNFEAVVKKEVPDDVPEPICSFIRRLIVRDVIARPNWEKEDLCETIRRLRNQVFGRERSDMKPIPGFE